MLTIENTHKLFRKDVGEWKIGRIEETSTSYIIQLNKPNGDKRQIMLERNNIGNRYELWMWTKQTNTTGIASSAVPKRMMLLLDTIRKMNGVIGSIELLIKD